MTLVHVAADDPHLVLVDDIAGRVPTFPVEVRLERLVLETIWLLERPRRPVLGAPDLVVADAREELLVARIPAADQPHAARIRQRSGAVPRSKGSLGGDLHPLIIRDLFRLRLHRGRIRRKRAGYKDKTAGQHEEQPRAAEESIHQALA